MQEIDLGLVLSLALTIVIVFTPLISIIVNVFSRKTGDNKIVSAVLNALWMSGFMAALFLLWMVTHYKLVSP